jgi:hypothetical protein
MSKQVQLPAGLVTDTTQYLGVITKSSGSGGAPTTASYITLTTDATLTNERVLTAGNGITLTDAGAGSTLTIAATSSGGGAPTTSSYVVMSADATLTSERVLTAGTGISITDGGANSTVTIANTGAPVGAQYVTLATDATLTSERVLTAGIGLTVTDGGAGGSVTIANVVTSPFNERVMCSTLHNSTTQAQTSGTASYVYLGKTAVAAVWKFVKFRVATAGAGAQTAEVGLFSSPSAPNGAAQTLTKLWADGTLTALTATGVGRNSTASAVSVPAGTNLWAACRFAMATTQPSVGILTDDWQLGYVLQATGSAALTTLTTVTPALTAAVQASFPDLRATMD